MIMAYEDTQVNGSGDPRNRPSQIFPTDFSQKWKSILVEGGQISINGCSGAIGLIIG